MTLNFRYHREYKTCFFNLDFGGLGGLHPDAPLLGVPLVSVNIPTNFRSLIPRRKLQIWHTIVEV